MQIDRRSFFANAAAGLGAAWLSANWPAALAASVHARAAALPGASPKLEFLSPAEATEISAIAARIIPSDGSPGATEAGAVYFIDRALMTFAADQQPLFRNGLLEAQTQLRAMFAGVQKFSEASPQQQDQFLTSLDDSSGPAGRPNRAAKSTSGFFEGIRAGTIAAFLIDPESEYAGNPSGVGWRLIGRETAHTFQPPFGFYDKDYPGWAPASAGKSK
jgi:gluconate 2-dehydrogenase gamma chain